MSTFQFTLILSGVEEITSSLADALYAATGGDIELNRRNSVAPRLLRSPTPYQKVPVQDGIILPS